MVSVGREILLGGEAENPAHGRAMLRKQKGGDGGSRLGDAVELLVAAVSVLAQQSVADGDVAGPVLRVDDHDPTRTHGDVVDVGQGPVGPVDVVEAHPPVLPEHAQRGGDESFALSTGRPRPLLTLGVWRRTSSPVASPAASSC